MDTEPIPHLARPRGSFFALPLLWLLLSHPASQLLTPQRPIVWDFHSLSSVLATSARSSHIAQHVRRPSCHLKAPEPSPSHAPVFTTSVFTTTIKFPVHAQNLHLWFTLSSLSPFLLHILASLQQLCQNKLPVSPHPAGPWAHIRTGSPSTAISCQALGVPTLLKLSLGWPH